MSADHDAPDTSSSPDTVQRNKELVLAFLDTVYHRGRVESLTDFVSPSYIQHNPAVPDGRDALVAFATGLTAKFPELRVVPKRVLAEGDQVMVYGHWTAGPDAPGRALVDIFRIEDGVIVEHWEVGQDVPAESRNRNGMF